MNRKILTVLTAALLTLTAIVPKLSGDDTMGRAKRHIRYKLVMLSLGGPSRCGVHRHACFSVGKRDDYKLRHTTGGKQQHPHLDQ